MTLLILASLAVLDCILALKLIKEHQAVRLNLETRTFRTVDLPMANQVIGQALRSANITGKWPSTRRDVDVLTF